VGGASGKGEAGRASCRLLGDPVDRLSGVGPSVAAALGRLGIATVRDLLRHFPRRYEDRRSFTPIVDLRPGDVATVCGRVLGCEVVATRRAGFQVTRALVSDGTGVARIAFFRQPYLQRQLEGIARSHGQIVAYGQVRATGFGPIEMEHPEWEEYDAERDPLSAGRIVPIYPLSEGIGQKRMRRLVDTALERYLALVEETVPADVRAQVGLMDARPALREVHFPCDPQSLEQALRRVVFEEFFVLQVALAQSRRRASLAGNGIVFDADEHAVREDLRRAMPFDLTPGQDRALAEISADMRSGRRMNRLLQGDVGSGKTLVAMGAILMAAHSGYQAALMAPTEILAQQHASVFRQALEPVGVRVALIIGAQSAKDRRSARDAVSSGEANLAIGTHALLQDDIRFARLGLAVIDEQHRFGVVQRQTLHLKGARPHVLVMTATPIPRTLSMTVYGDLDVSLIRDRPPGRRPVRTYWKRRAERKSVYAGVAQILERGRQAFIVCPLVEESEKLQAKAATDLAREVATDLLPGVRIGLLHGQLPDAEKQAAMEDFRAGRTAALVCTTIIEVGVDVPNACVMVVEDADRFGLAQLHQLRGRVGRGSHASFCVLIADPATPEGEARLQALVGTEDGFAIAEEDLRLRGPGELMGTRQSGLPAFFLADLVRDQAALDEARRAAFALVERDPSLAAADLAALRRSVERGPAGVELLQVS